MSEPILAIESVTKRFGGLIAVSEVGFQVAAGEIVGLMGPNGAGKSTLLNIIAGEFPPTAGTIRFQGRDISRYSAHQVCRLGVGRTYQIPRPFLNMTVMENIVVAVMYGQGKGKSEACRIAREVMDFTELTDKRHEPAENLQELTLKRLELARALATDPKLLIMDEAAAGLTEVEMPNILKLINDINQRGVTIILVEHVMRIMMEAVGRIVVMDNGVKIAEGLPKDVMNDSAVVEAYFG